MAQPQPTEVEKLTGLASRFGAFVAEQHPFALAEAMDAFQRVATGDESDEAAIGALRPRLQRELARRLDAVALPDGLPETTPRTAAADRIVHARVALLQACDGFLRRAALQASLTLDERLEILRGMILTRATDNRLKAFFTTGEIRYGAAAFQGKGFRSLGQEAIYAGALRLKRGARYRAADGGWTGDVIGPVIRDLGI